MSRNPLYDYAKQLEEDGDEVVVIENKKEDWWIPIHKDEVLVVYDREDDFLVLPERIFNKHYRYAV